MALSLDHAYQAFEAILVRLERVAGLPERAGASWHSAVLADAALAIPGLRPPIFPAEAHADWDALLRAGKTPIRPCRLGGPGQRDPSVPPYRYHQRSSGLASWSLRWNDRGPFSRGDSPALLLARKTYFNSWVGRLREALGTPEDKFARLVLATCARESKGATMSSLSQCLGVQIPDLAERTTTLIWLLDVLLNDGYLVEHQGRWRFRSGLLRRYWERHVR